LLFNIAFNRLSTVHWSLAFKTDIRRTLQGLEILGATKILFLNGAEVQFNPVQNEESKQKSYILMTFQHSKKTYCWIMVDDLYFSIN